MCCMWETDTVSPTSLNIIIDFFSFFSYFPPSFVTLSYDVLLSSCSYLNPKLSHLLRKPSFSSAWTLLDPTALLFGSNWFQLCALVHGQHNSPTWLALLPSSSRAVHTVIISPIYWGKVTYQQFHCATWPCIQQRSCQFKWDIKEDWWRAQLCLVVCT